MPEVEEPKKNAPKPSLLEQKVRKLMEAGLSRPEAIDRLATEESERRRTAVINELTAAEPKILKPTCPGCGADPLGLKRLRYEFGDGVVVEILFCNAPDCRVALAGQIVGMAQPR